MLPPNSVVSVLDTLAATITAGNPGHYTPGTYTANSCYGAVAHYLRKNPKTKGYLLFFGGGTDTRKVYHACLYSNTGHKIVDTFNGRPIADKGKVYYVVDSEDHMEEYPLLYSIKTEVFSSRYVG